MPRTLSRTRLKALRVKPKVENRPADRDATVSLRESNSIDLTRHGTAPYKRNAKPHALLLRKRNNLNREGELLPSSISTSASASTTPRTPSNAPAFGTVSRCEPMTSRGASGRCPDKVHADFPLHHCDRQLRGFHPGTHLSMHGRAAGERKVRVVSPGTSVICARSRHRAMICAARDAAFDASPGCKEDSTRSVLTPDRCLDESIRLLGGDKDLVSIRLAELERSTSRQCLFGIVSSISLISGTASRTAFPIAYNVCCTDLLSCSAKTFSSVSLVVPFSDPERQLRAAYFHRARSAVPKSRSAVSGSVVCTSRINPSNPEFAVFMITRFSSPEVTDGVPL